MHTDSILSSSPARTSRIARIPDAVVAALIAVLVGLLFLALNPLADVPMNDDFSWARSAEAFARTGKIVYNGWGNPILLPHIIIGGLLIKLFGFSHSILGGFGIISGMAFAASIYLLARTCRIHRALSLFVTALMVLNPVFLGCTPSFMSDVPSAFLYTVALTAFLKALHRVEDEEARYTLRPLPLGTAAIFAFLAGANRQILWAALLLGFAATFFYLVPSERWKKLVPVLAVLVLGAVGLSAWFAAQPYSVVISLEAAQVYWTNARDLFFWYPYKYFAITGLCLLPISLPLLVRQWQTTTRANSLLLGCLAVGVVPLLVFLVQPNPGKEFWNGQWGIGPYGQYATWQGVQVGGPTGYQIRPAMIPMAVSMLLHVLSGVGIGLMLWTIFAGIKKRPVASSVLLVASLSQLILPLPWYASGALSDRYLFTLTPMLIIALIAGFPGKTGDSVEESLAVSFKPYLLGVPFAAVSAVAGILFAQEYFAYTHAREKLYHAFTRDKHIPVELVDGGVETDGDTQIALGKYINNPNIKNPPEAFDSSAAGNCVFAPVYFPMMNARYVLSLAYPAPDLSDAHSRDLLLLEADPVDRADYYSILAPHKRTIYVYRVAAP